MKSFFLYICFIASIIACQRQTLVDEEPQCSSAEISFEIDWSLSQMDADDIVNVSIYAYPQDGGEPYLKISSNIDSPTLNLPIGNYSLLVMSDAVGDIEGTNFLNSSSYDSFSANVIERSDVTGLYYEANEDERPILNHGGIAAWRLEDFEVTEDMIWCQYCEEHDPNDDMLLIIQPTPVTAICNIEVRIENLNNAQSIEGVLRGFSDGATLSTNNRISSSDELNLYIIDFEQRSYDTDSAMSSGVVLAQLITFGKQPDIDATYTLDLNIILNSGELVTYSRDVTSQVAISDDFNIYINLTDNEKLITLPESAGTGFGVEEWGDNELVELL